MLLVNARPSESNFLPRDLGVVEVVVEFAVIGMAADCDMEKRKDGGKMGAPGIPRELAIREAAADVSRIIDFVAVESHCLFLCRYHRIPVMIASSRTNSKPHTVVHDNKSPSA